MEEDFLPQPSDKEKEDKKHLKKDHRPYFTLLAADQAKLAGEERRKEGKVLEAMGRSNDSQLWGKWYH